ncbi:MAG: putative PEP-binding protein, partial [Bacillota bacterium]|nr:putative PEP-binding protein [Bacillota bacterium]
DIHGIAAAEGVLTARGGYTSHAALVTRAMGKPGIVGCEAIYVDYGKEQFQIGEKIVKKGEKISIDGTSGEIVIGEVPTYLPKVSEDLTEILKWADEIRTLRILTNADTKEQAAQAFIFGAEGVGLCRTEHMFFEENRISVFQEMILAGDKDEREAALKKIEPLQKSDFTEIFKIMEGKPVIIRLFDPPLHEFLPQKDEDIKELSEKIKVPFEVLKVKAESLKELNPMLGHRGCRLGITFPEIYEMQTRAIMEAACELSTKDNIKVVPKIMIPLVLGLEEFKIIKDSIKKICEEIKNKFSASGFDYQIGTMIELPRAALNSDEIAKEADFFSFGTNDLTQTTLGISRDDAGRFLPDYLEKKIFREDPFVTIDENGVGELIKIGKDRGKETRKDLEVGICGEHG